MKRTHRKKELSELQLARDENRDLKSTIRSLKKRLSKLEKERHIFEEVKDEEIEESNGIPVSHQRCLECSKGNLVYKTVAGRYWSECDNCNYRTKTKYK